MSYKMSTHKIHVFIQWKKAKNVSDVIYSKFFKNFLWSNFAHLYIQYLLQIHKLNLQLSKVLVLKLFTGCCHPGFVVQFTRYVYALVSQLCLTLWDPTDYSPPGSSCRWDSPGKNTGVGCHSLLKIYTL